MFFILLKSTQSHLWDTLQGMLSTQFHPIQQVVSRAPEMDKYTIYKWQFSFPFMLQKLELITSTDK